MSVQGLKGSKQFLKSNLPTLGIDFGTKRIGVSISDRKGIVATPLDVIPVNQNTGLDSAIEKIIKLAIENRVNSILIGVPQAFIENHEKAVKRIHSFIDRLQSYTELEIFYYDESYSTTEVITMLNNRGIKSKSRKDKIDSYAAALILQKFLDETSKIETVHA